MFKVWVVVNDHLVKFSQQFKTIELARNFADRQDLALISFNGEKV